MYLMDGSSWEGKRPGKLAYKIHRLVKFQLAEDHGLNVHSLEDDEWDLVMKDAAIVAIAEFINTIRAPRKNEDDGERQEHSK